MGEKNLTYSMGLFVLFFGTKKQYNEIAHHTIWLTERYKSLLNDIFKNKILSDDFSFTFIGQQPPINHLHPKDVIVFMFCVQSPIYKEI